jgi:hypothetical protein
MASTMSPTSSVSEDGDVGLVVLHHHLGVELALVGKRNADLGLAAAADDMRVGHDHAVRAHDDAGAERALDALGRLAEGVAEELAEEGVVGERRGERLNAALDVDVDDGGRRLADDGRKRVLRDLARGRDLAAHGGLAGEKAVEELRGGFLPAEAGRGQHGQQTGSHKRGEFLDLARHSTVPVRVSQFLAGRI